MNVSSCSAICAELPTAGPTALPQLIEIDVAPWRRIAVLFRSVKAERGEESGTIWYWRPETAALAAA